MFDRSSIVSYTDFENFITLDNIVIQPKAKRPAEFALGILRKLATAKLS